MSQNTQWDSLDWDVVNFPYDRIEPELSTRPRFFRGENMAVTLGGKLIKRPGTLQVDVSSKITNSYAQRLVVLETLDTPPLLYWLTSVFSTTTGLYQIYYKRMSSPAPGPWILVPSYRDNQASTRPHEIVISRGVAYIKGYPAAASAEKLGTFIFDGTASVVSVRPWGLNGPTEPSRLSGATTRLSASVTSTATTLNVVASAGFPISFPFVAQIGYEQVEVSAGPPGLAWTVVRGANGTLPTAHDLGTPIIYVNWANSLHQVNVNYGWRYAYAYKTITGQISNRSQLATNPDKMGDNTGPFFDLIPKIKILGHVDTTNIPKINVYRTTDGGGTFYFLKEVANPGASLFDFEDKFLESGVSGGTFIHPTPDADLNIANVAPGLDSNSPPPTTLAPKITGVDPVQASTPVVSYSGRLWYAIGNVLFYSADEEINAGIPEECWPSGLKGANFFRYPLPVTNLVATNNALLVFTLKNTHRVIGSNRETFASEPFFENVGAPYGHPRAVTRYGNSVVFVTNDYRVARATDNGLEILSDPLFTDIVDAVNAGGELDIKYFGDLEKEWLVLAAHRPLNTLQSKQWILDIKKTSMVSKPFWFVPWQVRTTCLLSDRESEGSSQRRLIFAVFDPETPVMNLTKMDPTARTPTDWFITAAVGISYYCDFHQMLVPAGNHVNERRVGGITPTVYGLAIDRLTFPLDEDPQVYYYLDDLWTDPISPTTVEPPARRRLSKAYKSMNFGIHQACQHFSLRLQSIKSTDLFEMSRLTVIWNPDAGA